MAREFLTGIKSENRLSKVRLIMPNDPVVGGQPSDNADEFTSNTPFLDIACSIQYAITEVGKKANSNVNITAGNGLSGGGTLAATRTITLGTPTKITATSTNAVTTASHTHEIDNASLTVAGVVKLNSATNSTSETEAATPNAIKTVMDSIGAKANNNVSITAGNGLSGGGTLAATRTITLGTPTKITATSTNAVTTASHTHEIDNASLTVAGVVKLNSATNSTSTTEAATPSAVKAAYDKAVNAATTVVQVTGTSTTAVMSQKGVSDLVTSADGARYQRINKTLIQKGFTHKADTQEIKFPIAFSNDDVIVLPIFHGEPGNSDTVAILSVNKTGFKAKGKIQNGSSLSIIFDWVAFGE